MYNLPYKKAWKELPSLDQLFRWTLYGGICPNYANCNLYRKLEWFMQAHYMQVKPIVWSPLRWNQSVDYDQCKQATYYRYNHLGIHWFNAGSLEWTASRRDNLLLENVGNIWCISALYRHQRWGMVNHRAGAGCGPLAGRNLGLGSHAWGHNRIYRLVLVRSADHAKTACQLAVCPDS